MADLIELPGIKIDRQRLLELGRFFSRYEGTCLLYSGCPDEKFPVETFSEGITSSAPLPQNAKSFLCLFPCAKIEYYHNASTVDNPWDSLKANLKKPTCPHSFPEWIGFISYEMGFFAPEPTLDGFHHTHSSLPLFYFQRCALILEVNHSDDSVRLMVSEGLSSLDPLQRQWADSFADQRFWPGFFRRLGGPPIGGAGIEASGSINTPYRLSEYESQASYCQKVLQTQEWIRAGDIYQLNLSQQFVFKGRGDGFNLFEDLVNRNPAPFSAYLMHNSFTVISSSPELFLRKKQAALLTRPIKGTAPRGKNPAEDAQNRINLLASEKDRAELLMIVDLMRNDLGKISQAGSVITEKIWECESYTNVFHLVSTIRSTLLPQIDPVDIVRSCFPGGSITGCPKFKSMECIAKLEQRPRGIYTGSIGYFSGDGDFDFNIAIRTIVLQGEHVNVQLGGAVVIDSDPLREYAETFHKGQSIFKALKSDPLIETFI